MNTPPTELQKCLDGTSTYAHASKIKELYEKLESLGNNKEWQLYILWEISEGIRAKQKAENEAIDLILASKEKEKLSA
jgi:hypothetical protein